MSSVPQCALRLYAFNIYSSLQDVSHKLSPPITHHHRCPGVLIHMEISIHMVVQGKQPCPSASRPILEAFAPIPITRRARESSRVKRCVLEGWNARKWIKNHHIQNVWICSKYVGKLTHLHILQRLTWFKNFRKRHLKKKYEWGLSNIPSSTTCVEINLRNSRCISQQVTVWITNTTTRFWCAPYYYHIQQLHTMGSTAACQISQLQRHLGSRQPRAALLGVSNLRPKLNYASRRLSSLKSPVSTWCNLNFTHQWVTTELVIIFALSLRIIYVFHLAEINARQS